MVPRHSDGEFTCEIQSFVAEAPTRVLWTRQDGDPLPYDVYDDGYGGKSKLCKPSTVSLTMSCIKISDGTSSSSPEFVRV